MTRKLLKECGSNGKSEGDWEQPVWCQHGGTVPNKTGGLLMMSLQCWWIRDWCHQFWIVVFYTILHVILISKLERWGVWQTDSSVDKELAESSYPESCGKCLNIQVTIDITQGSLLGLALFNVFVSDTDSGIECTLNKFANNTKLCGAVYMLEGRDVIQPLQAVEVGSCELHGIQRVQGPALELGYSQAQIPAVQ